MRQVSSHHLIILGVTVTTLAILAFFVEPFDPDIYCCDHLYYRGQAEFWSGLGAANVSDIPAANRFWGVIANQETYYELANGLTAQSPYVFRPLVPLLAGFLGHIVGINASFYIITLISLILLGYVSGLAVLKLSGSILLAVSVAVGVILVPDVSGGYLFDYMLVDVTSLALVALVLYLVVTRHWISAGIVSAIAAPLTKETLVTLALAVAIAAFLSGVRSRWLWALPVIPILVQGVLRLSLPIPSPPPLTELFIPGDQIRPAVTLIMSFTAVSFLFYGLLSQKVRPTLIAFTPLFLLLIVITSSSAADSPRIWLTVWPVVAVLGAVGLHGFLQGSPTRFLWLPIPVLALVWLYFGSNFQANNQLIYFFLAYGLILFPPILIGLQYLWVQNKSFESFRQTEFAANEKSE
jgi:hypothetical protein